MDCSQSSFATTNNVYIFKGKGVCICGIKAVGYNYCN